MIRGGIVRLGVTDLDRAVRFYVETLGMKLVEEAEARAVIDCGDGFRLELAASPSAAKGGGAVAIGLHPKMPLDEAIAILENRGVVFDAERRFTDPDGHVLFLVPAG